MKRKDGYQSKLVGEQGRKPVENLFVAERQTRSQGKDSLVDCLPARSSTYENCGPPWTQENKKQSLQEPTDKSGRKNSYHMMALNLRSYTDCVNIHAEGG